jgi:glycogen synthase
VVGHAGILLEPTDRNVWAQAMRVAVQGPPRRAASAAALAQAALFSWDRAAEQYQAVYAKALKHEAACGRVAL